MTDRKTATIDAESPAVTLISVFEVEPGRQAELVQLLSDTTERVIRHQSGFISVNIHRSFDGTRVVNYAQWASKEDVERVMRSPDVQAGQKRLAEVAKSLSPGLYEVSSVHAG